MQVRGTFPELNSGTKKSPKRAAPKRAPAAPRIPGMGGFSVKRAPRPVNAPKSLAGRRAASHAKAYGC